MIEDPSKTEFSTIVFPQTCPLQSQGALDSVAGPMNLPVGVSAGDYSTYLSDGSYLLNGKTTDAADAPVLIHFNADGSLDSSFGTGGYLSGPAGGFGLSVSELPGGELLVSSQVNNQDGSSSEYVAEFTGSGKLDTNFGGGSGQLVAPVGTHINAAPQILADGSLLVSANFTDGNISPLFLDYNADGTLNTLFGDNGELSGPVGAVMLSTSQESSGSIQLQGWIVTDSHSAPIPFLEQFTSAGQPDTSFGGGSGSLTAPQGDSFTGNFFTLNSGDILVTSVTTDGNYTPVLVDYTSAGILNDNFGTHGKIVAPTGVNGESCYLDSTSGDIVVTDSTSQDDGSYTAQTTYYTPSGQVDTLFPGTSSTYTPGTIDPLPIIDPNLPVTISGYNQPQNLDAPSGYSLDGGWQMLQDGTTLASGVSSDGSHTPVLVDYNSDGSINSAFGLNGTIVGTPGTDYQYTYQDSNSGEIVFKQFTNQSDGSIVEVDTYYTTAGQPDPSNSPFVTTIIPDPIVIDPIPLPPVTGSGYDGTFTLSAPVGYTLDGGTQTLQDGSSLDSGWSTDGNYTPVLVDYNADGSINTLFGNNGELSGPAGTIWMSASQLADGSIQLQGNSNSSYGGGVFFEQFTSSGQLDTSFGGGAGSLTAPDGVSFNGTFTTLSGGEILASAITTDGNNTPVIVEYTSEGMLNTSFGTHGEIVAPVGVTDEWFYQENTQDGGNGDLVVFDHTDNADGSVTDVTTYYSENGQVDPNTPAMTSTYAAPVYYSDGTYDVGNIITYPVALMNSGLVAGGDAKSVSLPSASPESTQPAASSQQPVSASVIPETSVSSIIVSPTVSSSYLGTDIFPTSPSAASSVSSSKITTSSGNTPVSPETYAPVLVQSSYDLGASTEIAAISALKLAASAENRRDTNSSEDDNADLSASQDSNPFQIKQDLLDPSSTPKSEDMTIPAGTEADLPDQQEEGKNNVASVTQKGVSALLARNNLVTTISLGLPDFLH